MRQWPIGRTFFLIVLSVLMTAHRNTRADESVVNSVHNLSTSGPGRIRALEESRVCIFCHTPHNASPQAPLWNRTNPQTHYRVYDSSTTDARIDQPGGATHRCECFSASLHSTNSFANSLAPDITGKPTGAKLILISTNTSK